MYYTMPFNSNILASYSLGHPTSYDMLRSFISGPISFGMCRLPRCCYNVCIQYQHLTPSITFLRATRDCDLSFFGPEYQAWDMQ